MSNKSHMTFIYRKAKLSSRPLILAYPPNLVWELGKGPHLLMAKWEAMKPASVGFLNLRAQEHLRAAILGDAVRSVLKRTGISAPEGYYYGLHSARIGDFNELCCLQFSRTWVMHRLDWTSESMFQVFFDSRISRSPDSDWFFAHLLGGEAFLYKMRQIWETPGFIEGGRLAPTALSTAVTRTVRLMLYAEEVSHRTVQGAKSNKTPPLQ